MIINRQGLTFQVHNRSQIKFESIFRTGNLTNATQNFKLENLSNGFNIQLAGSQIGLNKPEIVTNSACLLLESGLYRWSQEISCLNQPNYLTHQTSFISYFNNFGIGAGNPFDFLNVGTDEIYTHMSSIEGRNIFARGKVFYDLLDNEELYIEVKVTDVTTGIVIGTGISSASGLEVGEIETGVVPYITKAGHLYLITLKLQTNATKKQNCLIIQHG